MPNSFLKIAQRFTKDGVPLVNYPVSVTLAGGNVPARLYSDANGTAKYPSHVMNTGANGEVSFFVDGGKTYRLTLRDGTTAAPLAVMDGVAPNASGVDVEEQKDAAQYVEQAYAAAITPNCSGREHTIINVAALTGNMTVNNPTGMTKGAVLTLMFAQDATGGRTITWDTAFSKAADSGSTASHVGATRYIYNGSKWLQLGGALTFRA
jgi:hypothetical protein